MFKNMSRALRRHHRARMYNKARALLTNWWGKDQVNSRPKEFHSQVCQLRDNMQICSCAGCGNPRKHFKNQKEHLTMSEKRNLDKYKYDLEEI